MLDDTIKNKQKWVKSGREIIDLNLKEVPTLLHPIIPKVGTFSLAGSSDLGKSYFLLQLANSIVKGAADFLDFSLNVTHKSVIYLSTEDDEFSLSPRLQYLSKDMQDLSVYDNLRVVFEAKDIIHRLDKLLSEKPADLVIIDTFSDVFDGDMNQANKVRSYIQKYKELANRYKTLIAFNHHCGKKNDLRPPHKDNLLGSQGFESSMRTVIELRKDFNNPELRHLCLVKGNYIPESFKNSSFELQFSFEEGFSNTGKRVDFDKLVKTDNDSRNDLRDKVLALRDQNLSYGKIAEKLSGQGLKISRSTIGNICKQYCPTIQEPIDDELDGQSEDDELDENFS